MKHNVLLIHPTIQPNGVAFLEENCNVSYAENGERETLIRAINGHQAEAVITRCEIIDEAIMKACPSLKVVGQHGVGLDNIDVKAATARGVKVLHVPDGNYISVAEHTMMFILALSRELRKNDDHVREGRWQLREINFPMEILGKNLLIVGLGRIGKKVAEFAKAFDMNVMAYDNYVPDEVMENLSIEKMKVLQDGLKKADFVTLHVPLTNETKGMISEEELKCMKPSAYIINMGRGPVIDQDALVQALKDGEIAGAGLDVLAAEPPEENNPLLQLKQVIFTPHFGGDTREAKLRTSDILSKTVFETLEGKETYNWVNKQ